MSEKVICDKEDLTAIANAVRASTGSSDTYNVSELSVAAVSAIENGGSADAVLYIEQTLTEEQKSQARKNIGAVSEDELQESVVQDVVTLLKIEDAEYIPPYYDDYLSEKITQVQTLLDEAGSDASAFILFSDSHQKQPYAPALAKVIADECGIHHVIFAGDNNGYSLPDETTTLEQMSEAEKRYAPIADKLLRIKGNHEGAYGTGENADDFHTSKAEVYSRLWKFNRADNYGGDGGYFYQDDVAEKTRYIVIDTFDFKEGEAQECVIRQAQFDWLKDALNVEDGWSVLCFCHVPPVKAYEDIWSKHPVLCEFLSAYKNKTTYNHVWSGAHSSSVAGGYTNLFDSSATGFSDEGTKFYTNWIPYSENDNNGNGTIYHIKGLKDDAGYENPYKFYMAQDANGTGATSAVYCTSMTVPPAVADYDSSVKIMQHQKRDYYYIRFEIREALPENFIITANEQIVETSNEASWDALNIDVDFSTYNGDFIAIFAGHMHGDYSYYGSRFGYAVDVHTVCCDANQLDSRSYNDVTQYPEFGGRQNGTVYEQCLDVVVVNRATRKIKTVRIGAGYDREFTYAASALPAPPPEENNFVSINQGSANVGKILVVGSDGNLILADMPDSEAVSDIVGVLDESNNIILMGALPNGTYTLKYEMADGSTAEVGSIVVETITGGEDNGDVTYTNLADQTSADWLNDKRINSSGSLVDAAGVDITNFIPITDSSVVHIKGLDIMSNLSNGSNYGRVYHYDPNKTYLGFSQPSVSTKPEHFPTADYDESVQIVDWAAMKAYYTSIREADTAFVRIGGIPTSDEIIITVDEPIV